MIIAQLSGGLGNQMFQYSLGRKLSLQRGCTLKLDLSNYRLYPDRTFELSSLAISYEIASVNDIAKFKPFGRRARIVSLPYRILRPGRYTIFREQFFHFDPSVFELGDDVYLEGYWQSYRYFHDVADIIRKDFSPAAPLDPHNASLAESISTGNSVSVHIRKGDYVSDSWARNTLGVCEPEYYNAAMDYIREKVKNPFFYIFSDDPDSVTEHYLMHESTRLIAHNGPDRGWIDQYLMSRCRHHIIANSTFSWWAAWLSPHPGKRVIAPKQWFRTNDRDTRDLLPPDWITV
jgi:hypothetical protein